VSVCTGVQGSTYMVHNALFFLVVLTCVLAVSLLNQVSDSFVGCTYLLLCIQSAFFLSFLGGEGVSLIKVYFIFVLIFMSVIPWIQYSSEIIFWGGGRIYDSDYLFGNVIIFISSNLIAIVYILSVQKPVVAIKEPVLVDGFSVIYVKIALAVVSILSLLLLLVLKNFSVEQLFFRGVYGQVAGLHTLSSPLGAILSKLVRLVPFFSLLYSLTTINGSKNFKFFLFLVLLLSAFPTSISRYMVAFIYIPLLLIMIKNLRSGKIFSLAIIAGIIFVFPFLEQFRYFYSFENISIAPDEGFFLAGHFDAYQNFIRVIQTEFVTYGLQLLGVFLFFVPRSLWEGKPVGSGYEMSDRLGYSFSNISMPFLGEGYVNFGVLGVFMFSVVLAYGMARLDKRFENRVLIKQKVDYVASVYMFLCGALVFLLRGDLMSSTAYILAGLFAALLVKVVCGVAIKR
jgi:hypothetical protein